MTAEYLLCGWRSETSGPIRSPASRLPAARCTPSRSTTSSGADASRQQRFVFGKGVSGAELSRRWHRPGILGSRRPRSIFAPSADFPSLQTNVCNWLAKNLNDIEGLGICRRTSPTPCAPRRWATCRPRSMDGAGLGGESRLPGDEDPRAAAPGTRHHHREIGAVWRRRASVHAADAWRAEAADARCVLTCLTARTGAEPHCGKPT